MLSAKFPVKGCPIWFVLMDKIEILLIFKLKEMILLSPDFFCTSLSIVGDIMQVNWKEEFSAAITVCDTNGTILEMNKKSASYFAKEGGYQLIGKNLFDCHTQDSVSKVKELITENKTNVYTIQKNGVKKLIYQSPWYENGKLKGLVELSFEIPFNMPHFIRS